MKKTFCIGLAALLAFSFYQYSSAQGAKQQVFPVIKNGETSHVVTAAESAGLIIDTLYLPRGFTLTVAPDVKKIDWSVTNIKFEDGATIDLSAQQGKPRTGASGASVGGQQGYCTVGTPGGNGADGIPGLPGVDMTVRNIAHIDGSGILWVKTDGGPGGDGGNGGDGQLGGGRRAVGLFHGGSCGGAAGGAGGRGGAPGSGGRVADVKFQFIGAGTTPVMPDVGIKCGPTQRPNTIAGDGIIAISGAPGCAGNPGAAGRQGGHG